MFTEEQFFSDNTLNIFTDASVDRSSKWITGYGAVAIRGGRTISIGQSIKLRYGTNNYGEINAIWLGIIMAYRLKYAGFNTINIFSDSAISIRGLNEWCYTWFNHQDHGILYSGTGIYSVAPREIANQESYKRIMQFIVDYQFPINFYHCKGHASNPTDTQLEKLNSIFFTMNGFYTTHRVLSVICEVNDYIDNTTRDYIQNATPEYEYNKNASRMYTNTFPSYDTSKIKQYSKLTNTEKYYARANRNKKRNTNYFTKETMNK